MAQYLVDEQTKEIPKELLENELIREAVSYMEVAAYSKKQLFTYDKWKLDIMTERGAISDARRETTLEIAKKLLKKDMSIEDITDITGLTKQQIEQIKTATNGE